MAGPSSSEVSADYCIAGDDGLAAQDDVLGAGDGRAARDFVACVLLSIHDSCRVRRRAMYAHSFDEFALGIVDGIHVDSVADRQVMVGGKRRVPDLPCLPPSSRRVQYFMSLRCPKLVTGVLSLKSLLYTR